jgi:hypothetical protein
MARYKYKLNELAKKATAKDAEKELKKPSEGFKVGQVTISDDGTSKSTITNIDSQTGAVMWQVENLPGFDMLYDELDDLVDIAKRVYVKTKEDKRFREFYDQVRKLRNSVRTHLRNEYPDQYKRIMRIGEAIKIPDPTSFADMDDEEKEQIAKITGPLRDLIKQFKLKKEVSMSGAAGSYLTPYAFSRKSAKKADDEDNKELGYKLVNEGIGNKINIARAKSHFKQGEKIAAINKKTKKVTKITGSNQFGSFNPKEYDFAYIDENFSAGGRSLGYYEEDDLIETVDLVHVKEPDGSLYGTGEVVKVEKDKTWVRFDGDTIKKFDSDRVVPIQEDAQKSANIHKQGQDPGATLGPGPAASPDGVQDNAYVKQFKFKLVPKNKDGTYVQKGSTLPVRKLWG